MIQLLVVFVKVDVLSQRDMETAGRSPLAPPWALSAVETGTKFSIDAVGDAAEVRRCARVYSRLG
jgi:hypothetical protein